ncbi:hypothetical protein [Lichenicola sp.]|uniref:hypothetical protein n=1 Tax=Lichenicola sp. TaxID=2804529 RepID=UPI003B00413A
MPGARPSMLKALLMLPATCAPVVAAAAPLTPPNPVAAMHRIAAEPFRYGGDVQGSVPELAQPVDQPPLHLSIGLSAPAADGSIAGEAILFTSDRHLVAEGPVSGRIMPGLTSGTAGCSLRLALPTQDVSLSGICTADTLSGEIVSAPHHVALFTRLASWWGDRAVAGRYWLTPASFDPPN